MYQIYAYHEISTLVPNTKLWVIVSNLKAVPLPMCCILKEVIFFFLLLLNKLYLLI